MRLSSLAALLGLLVGLTGCSSVGNWNTVQGSGTVVNEARQVSGFNRVSVSGSGQLTIVQAPEEGLEIETDDNLLPLIRSTVNNGQLRIGPQNVSLHPSRSIQYRLRVKDLNELHLSGSLRAHIDALKTERLALEISGSGDVKIERLDAGDFTSKISGSGHVSVAGHTDKQNVHISGSGSHRARDLQSQRADAHISGSGNATLWVAEELKAHISGSGDVGYRGDPAVDAHFFGSGRVHRISDRP